MKSSLVLGDKSQWTLNGKASLCVTVSHSPASSPCMANGRRKWGGYHHGTHFTWRLKNTQPASSEAGWKPCFPGPSHMCSRCRNTRHCAPRAMTGVLPPLGLLPREAVMGAQRPFHCNPNSTTMANGLTAPSPTGFFRKMRIYLLGWSRVEVGGR